MSAYQHAQYLYPDATGSPLFRVLRFPTNDPVRPKGLTPQRYENGKYITGMGSVKPVLYNLPAVIAATGLIFVVEGEKCANALNRLGLVATTNPFGAGSWTDDYSKVLTGKDVIFLPDNDKPGDEHAVKASRSMLAYGVGRLRRVDLPGLPDKGDIVDWLDAGNTIDDLLALVEAAPDYVPPELPKSTHAANFVNHNPIFVDQAEECEHYLWGAAPADMDRFTWVKFIGICKDAGVSMDVVDRWSQTCPEQYTKNRRNELEAVYKSLRKPGAANVASIARYARLRRGKQIDREWFAKHPELSRPAVTKSRVANSNSSPAVSTIVDSDLLPVGDNTETVFDVWDHGVIDEWLAWFRRMGKQCHAVGYTIVQAVIMGLHDKRAPFDADLLADYHIRLGLADKTDLRKLTRMYQDGIDILLSIRVLHTQNTSHLYMQNSANGFFFRSFDDIFQLTYDGYVSSRTEERAYPGYKVDASPEYKQWMARIDLRAEHFMGDIGKSETEARQIENDIRNNLKPQRNEVAERKAAKRLDTRLNKIRQKLQDGATVTPLGTDDEGKPMKWRNYSEFDAARTKGAMQNIPAAANWSQREWADFLGTSPRTAYNKRLDTGYKTEENIIRCQLTPGADVATQVRKLCTKHGGKVMHKMEVDDPVFRTSKPADYTAASAADHMADGRGVVVLIQKPSTTVKNLDGIQPRKRYERNSDPAVQVDKSNKWKPYYGAGFSARWVWSQLVLNLIQSGYAESEVNELPLPDAIRLARGDETVLHAGYADKQLIDDIIHQAEQVVEATIQTTETWPEPPPPPTAEQIAALPNNALALPPVAPVSIAGECPRCKGTNTAPILTGIKDFKTMEAYQKTRCCDCELIFDPVKEMVA